MSETCRRRLWGAAFFVVLLVGLLDWEAWL